MFWKALPGRIWLFSLLLIVGLGAAFLVILSWWVKPTITNQLLDQQQTVTRAEASNIASFFQTFGNSVAVLAKLSSMESWDEHTQSDLDAFITQWSDSGLVAGVALTDRRGVVKFDSDVLETRDLGASLADRDYFSWANNRPGEGEYLVGASVVSRMGGTKGQIVIPVVSPVFQNGVFAGAVVTSAELEPLTEHYLELMKVSDATDVYLIGAQGDLLYNSAAPEEVGMNVFGAGEEPFLGDQTLSDSLKSALNTIEEGVLTTDGRLISYSPVPLGDRNWLLVMASPDQQVVDTIAPFYMRQTAIFLLFSLSILFYGAVIARESQVRGGLDTKTPQKRL